MTDYTRIWLFLLIISVLFNSEAPRIFYRGERMFKISGAVGFIVCGAWLLWNYFFGTKELTTGAIFALGILTIFSGFGAIYEASVHGKTIHTHKNHLRDYIDVT